MGVQVAGFVCVMCGAKLRGDDHPVLATCSRPKCQRAVQDGEPPLDEALGLAEDPSSAETPPCEVCGKPVPVPRNGRAPRKTCGDGCLSVHMRRHRERVTARSGVGVRKRRPAEDPGPEPEAPPDAVRVRHATFGEGVVLETKGDLERLNHRVLFDDGSEKIIRAHYLEVLEA